MLHDKIIINLFFDNKKLNRNYRIFIKRIKKSKYKNIKNYLLNRYNDLTIGSKTILKESLYRILRHVDNHIKCPICGKYTTFNPLKENCYNDHCSRSCEMKDKNVMDKHNKTCLIKYGSVNNIQKCKQTNIIKYGVNNPAKSNIIKEKTKQTNIKKYGTLSPLQNNLIKEKTKQTNIKKYGYENAQQNEEVRNKIKESNILTCQLKYGVNNIMKLEEIYNKQIITKRKNNTFNTSIPENKSYKLLIEKYKDTLTQYKSELYPFNCDFYIPSLDLYIECNYFWTHGKHPFNDKNKEDIEKLNIWKEKSKTNKFYNNAINVWTIADVKKRNIAKQNNLNYIEFWNIEELKYWLNNLNNTK